MATLALDWFPFPFPEAGRHFSCLPRSECDFRRRLPRGQQSLGLVTLDAPVSRGIPVPLAYTRSNRSSIRLNRSSACLLVLCLVLLQLSASQSPFLFFHCHHHISSLHIPFALRVAAITQPGGGSAYAVTGSAEETAQRQILNEFVPAYRNYVEEQQQPLPPASPSAFQGDDIYQQQPFKTQQLPVQHSLPPLQQSDYRQDQYNSASASIHQAPVNLYNAQTATGAEVEYGTPSRSVSDGPRKYAAVNDKREEEPLGEAERQKFWDEPTQAIKLEKHSWSAPINYETLLAQWEFVMAAVPVEKHVVLVPAVAHRTGQLWHRSPLLTANFEVQFGFAVYGKDSAATGSQQQPQPLRGKGFAFWYVYEERNRLTVEAEPEAGDTSLFGYHSRPQGLGIFFKMHDKFGNPRPSISALYRENGREADNAVDVLRDIPVQNGIFFRFRNTKEPAVFKVAAGPQGVVGEIRTSSMSSWLRCFHLKDIRLRPGGFVGFTASNAAGGGEAALGKARRPREEGGNADLMVIKFLKIWNFHPSVRGEENFDLDRVVGGDGELEDILKLHSAHKNQKEFAEALRELSRVIYKYIVEHTPREKAMERRLMSLNEQMSRVEAELAQWRAEFQAAAHKKKEATTQQQDADSGAAAADQSVHALNSVSSELFGIKSLLAKHSQLHRETMESLKKKVEAARSSVAAHSAALPELRELANRARDIEASLAAKEQFSFLTMIGVLFILLSLALFVWKRFRDMEKKHLL